MNKTLYHIFALTVLMMFYSCDTPINKYKAKSKDENQIIQLLNDYQYSRNRNDMDKLKSTFHDNGVYISKDGIEWTKSKLIEQPDEWYKGQGSLEEMGNIKLYNPQIKINENNASVNIMAKYGKVYTEAHKFSLVKENNNWLIMKME